jgi:adenine-specific DNA-methyltransferase
MPNKYVPFVPEPVEGQAVLSNFNRILKYKGAVDDLKPRLQRGMPLYELETQETVGENVDNNMVIRGECVSTCAYLKDQGIEVDLVYIDPPFASGADYAKKVYVRRNPKVAEAIKQAEQEIEAEDLKVFEEKMYGDVWDKEKYLNWMYENLMAIKSIMSENASIYVHLDWHIMHYVKILMDEIFGEENFRNEIIWQRTYSSKKQTDGFGKVHDTILFYANRTDMVWNQQSFSATAEDEAAYDKIDENGRRYKSVSLTQQGQGPARMFGDRLIEPTNGMHWIWSQENIDKAISEGRIIFTKNGYPRKKQYFDEWDGSGKPAHDIWTDEEVKPVNSWHGEDTEYSTQKSEGLLSRILLSSSNENMIVADFFGGSGVTAAVANKLNRKFITCDIGINSIQTIRDRLKADGAEFSVKEIKDGVQLYRNPVQTMDKIKSLIPGLKNEDSLDSFWEGTITDSKFGTIPIYVPNLMDSTSKLLDKVLINRIIHQAIPDLDSDIKKVIIYYIDITDEKEIYDFIADDDSTDVEIELCDLKTILDDVVIEDYAEFSVDECHKDLFGGYEISIDKFASDRVSSKILEFNNKNALNSKKGFTPITISEEGLELIEFISVDTTAKDGEWHSDSEIKIDKLGFVSINGKKTKDFWNGKIRCDNQPLRIKIRNICGDETIWNLDKN